MSGESSKGFLIGNSTDTLIENNSITHTGTGDMWAVVLNNGANRTNVTNNVFNINNTMDLQLHDLNGAILINQFVKDYSITNAQFGIRNTTAGELQFLENVSPGSGFNFSQQIYISTNLVSVDSTSQPAFNVSANLSFFNINAIGITNRTPFRNGAPCGGICTLIQDADTYIFNVTQFTNYSVGGQEVIVFTFDKRDTPDPVSPGAQLSYTIFINITNGTMYNAVVNETYPSGVTFVSSSPAPTSGNGTFSLGNLSAGNYSINITVNVTAPAGTTLENTVNLTFENSSGTAFIFNATASTTVSSPSQTSGGGGGGGSSAIICPLSCAKMSESERAKNTYCSSVCPTSSKPSSPIEYSVPNMPLKENNKQTIKSNEQPYKPNQYQPIKEIPVATKENSNVPFYVILLLAVTSFATTIYFFTKKK